MHHETTGTMTVFIQKPSILSPPVWFRGTVLCLFFGIVILPILFMLLLPLQAVWNDGASFLFNVFDKSQARLITNSLIVAGGSSFSCMIAGTFSAVICSRTDMRGRIAFLYLSILPALIPPYIHAIIWTRLERFLMPMFPLNVHGLYGAVIVLTLSYFPFVFFLVLAGLNSIDRNLEEVSLLYHGPASTLKTITLPLVMPHILAGGIMVFIFSIVNISVPDILRVRVYPLEIFIQFSAFYDNRAATLLSLPLVCVTFLLLLSLKQFMKGRSYLQIGAGQDKRMITPLKNFHAPALTFSIAISGLSSILPVGLLAKGVVDTPGIVGKTLASCLPQLTFSVAIAVAGSAATLALGFFVACIIRSAGTRMATFLSLAAFLPLAIPGTTIGIGMIAVWNRPYLDAFYGSTMMMLMGYIARFIPFAVIIVLSGLEQIRPEFEESAVLAGRSFFSRMIMILIPLLRKHILVVFIMGFILCFGELGTTLLIIPPGSETLPVKLYNLMHYGAEQMVSALCLIVAGVVSAGSAVFLAVWKITLDRRIQYIPV